MAGGSGRAPACFEDGRRVVDASLLVELGERQRHRQAMVLELEQALEADDRVLVATELAIRAGEPVERCPVVTVDGQGPPVVLDRLLIPLARKRDLAHHLVGVEDRGVPFENPAEQLGRGLVVAAADQALAGHDHLVQVDGVLGIGPRPLVLHGRRHAAAARQIAEGAQPVNGLRVEVGRGLRRRRLALHLRPERLQPAVQLGCQLRLVGDQVAGLAAVIDEVVELGMRRGDELVVLRADRAQRRPAVVQQRVKDSL